MTTGKPMVITPSRTGEAGAPHRTGDGHDQEQARGDRRSGDGRPFETCTGTGTSVAIELEAKYNKRQGQSSRRTSSRRPSPTRTRPSRSSRRTRPRRPDARRREGQRRFERTRGPRWCARPSTNRLPARGARAASGEEIKPHPYGVELGTLPADAQDDPGEAARGFFKNEFCRVPPAVAKRSPAPSTKERDGQTWVKNVDHDDGGEALHRDAGLQAPQPPHRLPRADRVRTMLAGLLKG
jgi:hypothetical protein